MKKLILTVTFGASAVVFAACETPPSTTANSNSRANSAVATANTPNANSHAGMNHNSMGGMNHNGMAMNHSEMMSSPNAASQPFDLQFLDTMAAHHQGAVEMAEMALRKTQNAELKTFAQKIIDDQKKEIAQMKDWREKWYAGKSAALNMEMSGMKDSMKMMTSGEMAKMEAATGKEFDVLFLDLMTPHHAGAVTMAKDALTKAEHAEIKTLSNQIIKSQEAEIKQMATWKTKWQQ